MIPVPAVHIFSIYLVCWLLILTSLWLRDEIRRKRSSGWSVVKKRLYFCDNCHLSFLARNAGENVSRCPRCNELCFIRKSKHF